MRSPRFVPSGLVSSGIALAALAWPAAGDDDRSPARSLAAPVSQEGALASAAAERAVEAGLAFLATLQQRAGDGSFAITDADRADYAPLGISALCTLAFMAAGSAPGRGPHGDVASRAVEYMLLHTDVAADAKWRGYISAQGDELSRTHGHGYATLVLAEAYGMAPGTERVKTALMAAVERIETSQGSEGGFGYEPYATPFHEGSVTICMVQALRAARDAGIQVDPEVIRRAEDYVLRLQAKNGLFCYTLGDVAAEARASVGLTAAAISTLNAAGRYDDRVIQGAVDAMWSALALRAEGDGEPSPFPEYERLYLAQALWQLSDTSQFQRWFEEERERILRTQERDGSWSGPRFGSAYTTAVNCLVLSLPDAALPVFQR